MPPGGQPRVVGPDSEADEVDLAIAVYRYAGDWRLQELADASLDDVATIARELRRYPTDEGAALALVAVDDDFFLLVRARGSEIRLLLSDASAATDWALARSAVDHLGLPVEDDDEPMPAGDLGLLADMGFQAIEMGELLDEIELYPDEQLSDIATKLGFGPEFDDLAGLSRA